MSYDMTPYNKIRKLLPGSFEQIILENHKIIKNKFSQINQYIDPDMMEEMKNKSNDELAEELDFLLKKNIKSMTPKKHKYASILSGGVDSSLVSYYLNQNIPPEILVAVNHVGKDKISNDLKSFEKVFNRKIEVINIDQVISYLPIW